MYRAVDEHGQVIDVLVSRGRDITAARSFVAKAVLAHGHPDEVVTDRAAALAHVIVDLLPGTVTTPTGTPTAGSNATMVD